MDKFLKHVVVLSIGALAGLYIINPTAGVLEFIPDVIPIIGNLDEGAAMVLLVSVARFYGLDLSNIFKRDDLKSLPPKSEQRKLPPTS